MRICATQAVFTILLSLLSHSEHSKLARKEKRLHAKIQHPAAYSINRSHNFVSALRSNRPGAKLTYYSHESGVVASQISYTDRAEKVGNCRRRRARKKSETVKGETATFELNLQHVHYLK